MSISLFPKLNPSEEVERCIPLEGKTFNRSVVRSLLPDQEHPERIYNKLTSVGIAYHVICQASRRPKVFIEALDGLRDTSHIEQHFRNINIDFVEFVELARLCRTNNLDIKAYLYKLSFEIVSTARSFGFKNVPFWIDYLDLSDDCLSDDVSAKYLVTLKDLNLVDIRNLSWEKLIEFRKDAKSISALRDLRLFFSDNFTDKNTSYISDRLGQLIENHNNSIKLWGFETVQKSLSVALKNQSILASSVGALATQVAGAPLAVAAASGALITLGSCGLEFAKVYIDAKRAQIDNPVRYLTMLKSELPSKY